MNQDKTRLIPKFGPLVDLSAFISSMLTFQFLLIDLGSITERIKDK
jgi:hypothetical protein